MRRWATKKIWDFSCWLGDRLERWSQDVAQWGYAVWWREERKHLPPRDLDHATSRNYFQEGYMKVHVVDTITIPTPHPWLSELVAGTMIADFLEGEEE